MSDTGIEELAADEDFVQAALKDALHLQVVFGGSIIMLLVSYMYYRLVPESLIFTLIVLFVGAIYYIFLILKWQYDFRKLPMWNTTAQTANRAKNIAAMAFLVEVTLIVLYLFINW